MSDKILGRLRATGRWLANFRRAIASPALLAQTFRETLDEEREFSDAVRLRLSSAEVGLSADARDALANWSAIERSPKSTEARMAALRVLYVTLLSEHEKLRAQQRARADAAGAGPGRP